MLIFTLLLTIPFIILSIIIPSWFTSIMEEQIENSTIEKMDQYSLYIHSVTAQAEEVGKQILVNQTTQRWLKIEKEDEKSINENLLMKNQLKHQLSSIMINNSYGISITVFLNDGTGVWWNNPSLPQTEWFKNFTANDQKWVAAHIDPFQQSQEMRETKVNSYLIPLFDLDTFQTSGVIKVNFPTSLLHTALRKIPPEKNGNVYLLDSKGEDVLAEKVETPKKVIRQSLAKISDDKNEKGLIKMDYEGEEHFVFFQKLSVGDWILMSEVSSSDLFSTINKLRQSLLLICSIIFITTIVASFKLSVHIVSPLEKLTKAMTFVERGEFAGAKRYIPTIDLPNHEVGYVINVFGRTIDRLNHLIETEYEANIRRKNAEYKALLLQINPHFMNNTLEIIGGLAAQGKNEDVINVSIDLARMMRYSLNTKSDVVNLEDELNYIKNFTDILKMRYEESLTIEIQEDPKMKAVSIIKFILQPLVENAVKYSFERSEYAEILIKTKKVDDQLLLEVKDNGAGMPKRVMKDLLLYSSNDSSHQLLKSSGSSIGLRNVLGRLIIYYGQNFSYDIQSEINGGTKISLWIKITKGDQYSEAVNCG
ncbi:sensor histidine kinase [Bacillus capparidis]|nr:sensor histidine kinase [Bacillus capparidis]MBP1082809.1 two-component system sensor histidine kinase YesM [Bacillus capparidis]MED1098452.1 histidine kinase [Bacillus capparidis]